MAGNNTIQILRGNNVKTNSSINRLTLLDGQPLYDRATGYLYIGEGGTIASTSAINAHYANSAYSATQATTATKVSHNLKITAGGTTYTFNGSKDIDITISSSATGGSVDYATTAGHATTADTANKLSNSLFINNGTSNVGWDGSVTEAIYVPTSLSTIPGQVWGIKDGGGVGWISQTAIPGSIEQANTANFATKAEHADTADTADFATEAGSVSHSLTLIMPGSTVTYDGSGQVTANIIQAFACVIGGATANMVTTGTAQTITGQKTFNNTVRINDGLMNMSLSNGAITCDGRTYYFGGSGTWDGDTVVAYNRNEFTTSTGASDGIVIGDASRLRFITAWMTCQQNATTLAIRNDGTDLASAYGAVGERVCISCLVPSGVASRIYAPGFVASTENRIWYTCFLL